MEYMQDVMTAEYYDRTMPYEDDLVKEAQYGTRLWKSGPVNDPWELLAAAVVSHAAKDYVQAVLHGDRAGAEIARQFFQKNGFLTGILAGIDWQLSRARTRWELERLYRRMRVFW